MQLEQAVSSQMPHQFQGRTVLAIHKRPRAQDQYRVLVVARFPGMSARYPDSLSLHGREEFPPVQRGRVGLEPAGLLPDGNRAVARHKPAAPIILCPAPYAVQASSEVLERVTEMGHLPIQDAVDVARFVIEELPGEIVAVHDADLLRG